MLRDNVEPGVRVQEQNEVSSLWYLAVLESAQYIQHPKVLIDFLRDKICLVPESRPCFEVVVCTGNVIAKSDHCRTLAGEMRA